MDLKRTL